MSDKAHGKSLKLNLGNGQGYSVREVIDLAGKVSGRTINATIAARRPGDPPRLVGDSTKARKLLGWEPKYSKLETILEHAWQWHQKRFRTDGRYGNLERWKRRNG